MADKLEHPLVKQLLTTEVRDALEAVLQDGADKHPDFETNKPVDLRHEWYKVLKHAILFLDGVQSVDPDSGQHPLAHSAMRLLKMLRAEVRNAAKP